ncbi:MAG: caspase domain-containing protein, partial [Xenococcus sp. (in: cyanobacteria)]
MDNKQEGKRIALLIGVTDYGDGFGRLQAPEEDVAIMSKVLGNPEIGAFKVTSLMNPNLNEMGSAIEEHFDSCQSDDLILFYFSGHGYRDLENFYFLNHESCRKNRHGLKLSSALEASFLHNVIKKCQSQQQVIILDCCYSGGFESNKGAPMDSFYTEIGEVLRGEGRAILTSSSFQEPSYESKLSKLSVYTRHLAAGMQANEVAKQGRG